jgi:hypothetical protein
VIEAGRARRQVAVNSQREENRIEGQTEDTGKSISSLSSFTFHKGRN